MLLEVGFYTDTEHATFDSYLEEQTEIYVESLQDEADNEWHHLLDNISGEDMPEAGKGMERWWDYRIAEFQKAVTRDYFQRREEEQKQLNRRLRRRIVKLRRAVIERDDRLLKMKAERDIADEFAEDLRHSTRCPECKGPR